MYGKILSADVRGVEAFEVTVEADVSDGMPMFQMVGYLSAEVREASDRVRTALRNCGIFLPAKRITVNLAPAGIRKAGSKFDLPIAVALLTAMGNINRQEMEQVLVIGELRLNGEIHGIPGVLPVVEAAKAMGVRYCLIPRENIHEASMIPEMKSVGISHLRELLDPQMWKYGTEKSQLKEKDAALQKPEYDVDFSEICGQENVKRASQVAVAGMHNFMMIGPPGSGKTMIAKRIPTILPPLTLEESLEISKVYSIAGLLSEQEPLITTRPFRAPHHTISAPALLGGGRIPVPGEISLAVNGVLFLDELPEFQKQVLEVLRQPLEEGKVRISRSYGTYVYPARFMLVAAMNPCKCGFYPDMNVCTCSSGEIGRYLERISQPLLDRMDICVEAPRMSYTELTGGGNGETSQVIRERMENIHQIQQERYKGTEFRYNADLNKAGIEQFCPLGKKEKEFLEQAFRKLNLSARGYHRLIKVSRTIADMDGAKTISCAHLMEAVCYRSMDKKYWRK